jgi:hypothetical protein
MKSGTCFANKNGKCSVLTEKKCNEIVCRFYKSNKQFQIDKERTYSRMLVLDPETRKSIVDKYYKGKAILLREGII